MTLLVLQTVIKRRKEKCENQERQVMHNPIAHYLLSDAQLIPEHQSAPFQVAPPTHTLGMTFYGTEYLFDQIRSAVLAVLPSSFSAPPHWRSTR